MFDIDEFLTLNTNVSVNYVVRFNAFKTNIHFEFKSVFKVILKWCISFKLMH